MAHALVMALFEDAAAAADAARDLRKLGISRERVSIVARTHDEEGALAQASGASPGSEIEDSATAARLGELGAHLVAAIGVFMPGVGPVIAAVPSLRRSGKPQDISQAALRGRWSMRVSTKTRRPGGRNGSREARFSSGRTSNARRLSRRVTC